MENIREHLYLAALLHDIGKFYQRADRSFADIQNELSVYSKRLANDICPITDYGRFGYQHVVWTNQFLEKFESKFECVLGKQNLYKNGNENALANLACNHHSPKTEQQALVSLADWWSAGIDRVIPKNENEGKSDIINWGNDRYKKIPLYSVFNRINEENYHSGFPMTVLGMRNDCFPKDIAYVSDGVSQERYKKHWDMFIKEFDDLPTDSFAGFVESLLYLLKKYTWCIPSNTMDMADVSLFEHLKTTAAFSDCLFLYKEENSKDFTFNNLTNRLQINDGVFPVLLVGGDISGIQKFIYDIASRKAAVSLKGRSFYLQLLIDSVIQRIITHSDINVTPGHTVYSSGGKFYMLLPNTEKVKKSLSALKNEFEKELWNKHFGQLNLALEYVPFTYSTKSKEIQFEEGEGKTTGDLWKCLSEKLTTGKNRKFQSVLLDSFDSLFSPEKFSIDIKVCAVTGIESEKCVPIDLKDSESPYVLPIVEKQVLLGQELKDADYYVMHTGKEANTYLNNRCKPISIVGIGNYLFDRQALMKDNAEYGVITSADATRIKRINDTDSLAAKLKGQNCSYGFQFYGGNKQALNEEGEIKTFEDLANKTYLGILRMDVDNLGSIFIRGIQPEQKTFAAYATLSFLLDYFFSGYLNTIRNSDKFKDDVNIIYSGGDDVFAVGHWGKLIEFAHEIRVRFEEFVGRPDITISGGITIVKDDFPIAKAAIMAGKAEKKAKGFNHSDKNALNLFNENISWKNEFDYMLAWKKQLKQNCDRGMPRSILHKVMSFAQLKSKGEMKYVWHTVYFLKRFSENKKDEIKMFCEELKKELLTNSRNYELMAIAARWAELEFKEYDKNNSNNNLISINYE